MSKDQRRLLAAPDKFKGTATAAQVALAIANGAAAAGWIPTTQPLSDGGEGLIDVAGGPNRWTDVTGPLGTSVTASWRFDDETSTAVIEMSQAAGLVLAGGAEHNDPLRATTRGVGELIVTAVDAGAKTIIVGCGGSATTDGGEGALSAIGSAARLAGVGVVVACDVRVGFREAARLFAPQKGASARQVEELHARLVALARQYDALLGRAVSSIPGSGAAGGLAGGLAVLGGELRPGVDLVAEMIGLDALIGEADVVLTGEGSLDATSFVGKVVGDICDRTTDQRRACVVGQATPAGRQLAAASNLAVLDLREAVGEAEAVARPLLHITTLVAGWLGAL